ncbi:DNA cytosine methyltransferase [Mycobacterium sp. 1245499.0]|uniref:DNA cytosine methyltransferase n=2 Tax=unclassified Mycobacterium TaxID=2642494 RepID=UPI001E508F8C|nr:DNA cytosine methyltransferase [Mycobacterium sp. 1245499.0]
MQHDLERMPCQPRSVTKRQPTAAEFPANVGGAGYGAYMAQGPRSSSRGKVRVLDLFSGAGGLSEGFSKASKRYTTIRAVELDDAAAATYAANHGKTTVYAGAIQDWLRNEEVPQADVIIGGPPCQGFSALGKQNVRDSRNRLWEYYARTIGKARPRLFVLENVPAFLTSSQHKRFREMCSSRGELSDYAFEAEVLNAADYGAAQIRKRVILIGHHRDIEFPGFPSKTHGPPEWRTVKEVLLGLPEVVRQLNLPARWYEFRGNMLPGSYRTDELHVTRHYEHISLQRFAYIKPGGNRFQLPDDLKPDCWRKHTSGAGDVMGRLWWDRPSVTIRTEFFKPEKGRYLHPTEPRALTHQEAALIQGFRDSYRWVGTKTSIARQIGNAVPIPLAKALGRHLEAFL